MTNIYDKLSDKIKVYEKSGKNIPYTEISWLLKTNHDDIIRRFSIIDDLGHNFINPEYTKYNIFSVVSSHDMKQSDIQEVRKVKPYVNGYGMFYLNDNLNRIICDIVEVLLEIPNSGLCITEAKKLSKSIELLMRNWGSFDEFR